jgi:hypothetical protein
LSKARYSVWQQRSRPATIPDERNVTDWRTRAPSAPTPRSSRQLRLVGELLRSEARLMRPPEEALPGGPRTASDQRGSMPRTESQKATPPSAEHAEAQSIDASVARRRQQRRSERAFAGWLAGRMRARAHATDVTR